jgi:iron complex transport system substrate-binding protein
MSPRRLASLAIHAAIIVAAFAVLACRAEAPLLRDDLGRGVAIETPPRRVVTLAPNITELVAWSGGGATIVATDDFSDHPPELASLPKVGGLAPDLERIASLRPDLVIASSSGNHPSLAGALERLGIPLWVVRTDRLDQIPRAAGRLAGLLRTGEGETAERRLTERIEAERRSRSAPPRTLFVVWPDPMFVAGRATYVDDLLNLTGAENVAAGRVAGWSAYSLEELIASGPELILYPAAAVGSGRIESFRRDPRLRTLSRDSTWIAVDDDLFMRPGPRIADAAARLNAILDGAEAAANE